MTPRMTSRMTSRITSRIARWITSRITAGLLASVSVLPLTVRAQSVGQTPLERAGASGIAQAVSGERRVPGGSRGISTSSTQAIREARARSNLAIAAHEVAGVVAEMMPDVHVVSSAGLQIAGREQNRARFAEQFVSKPDIVYRRTPDTIDVFSSWGMAAERGRWRGEWTDPDGKVRVDGVYFAKWQKTGPIWRIQSETFVPLNCRGGAYCRTQPNVPGLSPDSGLRLR